MEQSLQRHLIEQLQNKDIITQIDKLSNDIKTNTDIDFAVEKFKDILLSVAKKSLPKRRSSTKVMKNTRKSNKKWFDHSCHEMKTKLNNLANLLERYPNNPYVRGKLITTRKEYRKLIKRKIVNGKICSLKSYKNLSQATQRSIGN